MLLLLGTAAPHRDASRKTPPHEVPDYRLIFRVFFLFT
jgi:hypothetical protein